MNCPSCKFKLKRVQYESAYIHVCEQCNGNLVRSGKLANIESNREKTKDDLMDQLIRAGEDTTTKVRCPRCLSTMEKKTRKISTSKFSIDCCKNCQMVWLDAGELAKLQVVHEYSLKGQEQQKFRERLQNMTPAEKKELDDRIANLPIHIPAADEFDLFDTLDIFDLIRFMM